jgi:hypothetical protein
MDPSRKLKVQGLEDGCPQYVTLCSTHSHHELAPWKPKQPQLHLLLPWLVQQDHVLVWLLHIHPASFTKLNTQYCLNLHKRGQRDI